MSQANAASKPLKTMKQIAADLGLSVQAVSLALNNRKGVSEETRRRVLRRAKDVGYTPDAGLRALADFRTRTRRAATRWNQVALVHNWLSDSAFFADPFYCLWFRELNEAAKARGIEIQPQWLGPTGERVAKVFRALRNRGIHGVFVAPAGLTPEEPRLALPRGAFQFVTFGPEHLFPDLHTVQFDFYGNLRTAYQALKMRGHSRIGLLYSREQGWRTGHAWRAAYHIETTLAEPSNAPQEPLEIGLHDSPPAARKALLAWLRKHRWDALISSLPEAADWAAAAGRQLPVAHLNASGKCLPGIDLNLPQMARTGVELLALEMLRSLQHEQGPPFRVHIPGRWVDAGKREPTPESLATTSGIHPQ